MTTSVRRQSRVGENLRSGFVRFVELMTVWSLMLGGSLVMGSCTGTTLPAAAGALLQLDLRTHGAVVLVDGRAVRSAVEHGLDVEPGVHRIEVRADGYLPRRYEAVVGAGDVWVVVVELWPCFEELDGRDACHHGSELPDARALEVGREDAAR